MKFPLPCIITHITINKQTLNKFYNPINRHLSSSLFKECLHKFSSKGLLSKLLVHVTFSSFVNSSQELLVPELIKLIIYFR